MYRRRHTRPTRQAAAAVEFAATLPLLMLLLLGIWEVGRLFHVNQVLDNSAREGARQAASGQFTDAQIKMVVCNYLKTAGLPDYTGNPDAVVTVSNLTHPGVDSMGATTLDQIHVTISIPSSDVRWIAANYFMPNNFRVKAAADWYSTRNSTYPSTVTSPPGY